MCLHTYIAMRGTDPPYLKTAPVDSFAPGPIIYRRTGGEFLLYSFSSDLDDDGGTPSNWGRGAQGGDQVFWPVQEPDADAESAAEGECLPASLEVLVSRGLRLYNPIVDFDETMAFYAEVLFCPMKLKTSRP